MMVRRAQNWQHMAVTEVTAHAATKRKFVEASNGHATAVKHAQRVERSLDGEKARTRLLKKIIQELLQCYWEAGDGEPPPEFIQRAITESGYVYKKRTTCKA